MEELISELSKTDASVNGRLGNETTNDFSLQQNVPNPSSEETWIDFSIPKNVNQASIYIYDLQGRQVKRIDLSERGNSFIMIRAGELSAGRYLYTLIADGKEVGTKKMILTEWEL